MTAEQGRRILSRRRQRRATQTNLRRRKGQSLHWFWRVLDPLRHRPRTRGAGSQRRTRPVSRIAAVLPLLTLLTLVYLLSAPVTATLAPRSTPSVEVESASVIASSPADLVQQSRTLYDAGRFDEAISLLQQAIQGYDREGDRLQQAMALSNLSLAYQQVGNWSAATAAIDRSLSLLESLPSNTAQRTQVLAQVLDVQGRLQLMQGQPEQALDHWKQAASLHQQLGNSLATVQSHINQAQALQELGLYRRAIAVLTDVGQQLLDQPDSSTKAIAFRSLGDALLVTGDASQARQALESSLQVAEALAAPDAIAATHLSLGNLTRSEAIVALSLSNMTPDEAIAQLNTPNPPHLSPTELIFERRQTEAAQTFYQQVETALSHYQQAASQATSAQTQIQAQLNRLGLLVETQQWDLARSLYPQVQAALRQLPLSRTHIYDQIDLAQSVIKLTTADKRLSEAAQLLAIAADQAQQLGDARAQSYALGHLGGLYEQTQQWQTATDLTEQALLLAQQLNAGDVAYRWQWQLGRLAKQQGNAEKAIAAYSDAVTTLQSLRNDLVAINRDVQFSFRESVEPVYRELVNLLLHDPAGSQPSAAKLVQARDVIEGLQIAELDNFFREACLDTAFQLDRVIDQVNLPSAVVYTIVLPDRLDVILKLPQQSLQHFTQTVSQQQIEETADALIAELKRPYTSQPSQALAQQLYEWLLRPAEPALANSGVETMVFVLDGALRNVPMAALYDGQQYLIERYSVALAPGLQLPDPKPLDQRQFRALVAGLSEARSNFPALNYVETEVEQIQSDVPSEVLLNQRFTTGNFQRLVGSVPFSIVHVATHGQFSSNAAETFILAWDSPINVNELGTLLQTRDEASANPIELLVLSACRTAAGDKRATLGLAGVAVRAGARSTIASLWNLDDDSGAVLMSEFYQNYVDRPISKAEALRQAQRSLLANPQYAAPRFWAPYILLGNWL